MKSPPDRSTPSTDSWTQWLSSRVHGSIVTRTTLAILLPAIILGLTFASFVSVSVERSEQQRAQIRVQQLLLTVEKMAQIACYLKDAKLAGEIAQGLSSNRELSAVTITAGQLTLAQIGTPPTQGRDDAGVVIARPIYSPFDSHERVGTVSLLVDHAAIHAEAASYSRDSTLAVLLEVALVAAGVAIAVHFYSTRPIRAVSNELHQIRSDTGALLHIPPRHRLDEIGTLVSDVNTVLTAERRLRKAHEVGERKLRLIFEKAESGLFVLDECGILESWNPAFLRLLRLSPEQLPRQGVPTSLHQLLPPHATNLNKLIRQCLSTGQSCDVDLELRTAASPTTTWIGLALNPIGPGTLQGIINNITERKQGELSAIRMAGLATHDALTGLLNRLGLHDSLSDAFSRQTPPELALLAIDLDYFKEVNDAHGHEAGDRVLSHVARVLERNARRGDLIARWGGDEFTIGLVGIADPLKAEQIANAIIADLQQPIDLGTHSVQIGASIGIAFVLPDGDALETLLRRADAALYSAKRAGRGLAVRFADADSAARPQTGAAA